MATRDRKNTRQSSAKQAQRRKATASGSGKSSAQKRSQASSAPDNIDQFGDSVAHQMLRSRWNVFSHVLKSRVTFLLVVSNVVLVLGFVLYTMSLSPERVYFAVRPDNKIIRLQPVSDPVYSEEQVKQWVSKAMPEAFSMSFARYRDQLSDARKFFAEGSFEGFLTALREAKIIETMTTTKSVISASLQSAPRIIDDGQLAGSRYAWQVQFDMLLTYEAAGTETQSVTVTAIVVRVPQTQNPQNPLGLGIKQVVAQ